MWKPRPRAPAALSGVVAALFAVLAPAAVAEEVRDPTTGATFAPPDGWVALVETRPSFTVHRRVAQDQRAACGLLAGPMGGDLEALLAVFEGFWREGPETFVRATKSDAVVGGLPALRVEYRIDAGGRPFRGLALLAAASGVRAVAWAAWDAADDAAFAPVARRTVESLALPPPPKPPLPGERMQDPRFREGNPAEVLVESPADGVPLLRASVDAYVDLIEAAYDLAFSPSQEQEMRDAVESAYPRWSVESKRFLRSAGARKASVTEAFARGDAASAQASLAAFASSLAARIAVAPAVAWHLPVRAAKARRETVFSPGETPVSLNAANAYEQTVLFLLGAGRNEDPAVTPGQSQAVRSDLAKAMGLSGAVVRRHYARLHRLWLILEARWDASDDDARLRMRWAAVGLLRRLAGMAPLAASAKGDLRAYAASAAEVAAAMPRFDAYAAATLEPQAVIGTVLEGLGMGPAEVGAPDLDALLDVPTIGLR